MKKTLKLTTFLFTIFFAQSSFASGTTPAPKTVEGTTSISSIEAKKMFDEGVLFIDTRRANFFKEGHIPKAINISTRYDLSKEALEKVMKKDTKTIFYCHGAFCPASSKALERALNWGFTNLYYYRMGMNEWKELGYPVTIGTK